MIDEINSNGMEGADSLLLDLSTLRTATMNFNESNKLGEGGFGSVYKVNFCINFLILLSVFFYKKKYNLLNDSYINREHYRMDNILLLSGCLKAQLKGWGNWKMS